MNKKDKSAFSYLSSIDTGPLLTRAQEEELVKKIEVHQKEIMSHLISSKYAKTELKMYLSGLISSGKEIVDVSKKLDDESSEESQNQMRLTLESLISELDFNDFEKTNKLLNEVSLTGTIIYGVVTEIKDKYNKVVDAESKYKSVKKYFYNESDADIHQMIYNDASSLKQRLKTEYALNDVKVQNKINEWKQILNTMGTTLSSLFDSSFSDVKSIYSKISVAESEASKYRNELISKNLRLVVSIAKDFQNKGLDFEDLIQEGNLGLIKAVDKFDSSKKTKISTYATWWISQSIRRGISNKGKTVRVPTHIEWMQTQLAKVTHKLTGDLKRPPTLKELSTASGIDLKTLEDLHTRASHEIGLEDELSSGMSLADILPATSDSPYTITEQRMLRERIREILSTLPPRTEKIIRLRFGIGEVPDDEGITLQAIADQIGITKQGVRVVECSAFKHLRKKAKGLENE